MKTNRSLISGATEGIGTAISEMLVEISYNLILLAKNKEKLLNYIILII